MATAPSQSSLRLAELVGALSLATDLGMGQPMDHALRTCVLTALAGRSLGLPDSVVSDAFYVALLRFVGCTSDAHEEAARSGGDDIAFPIVQLELDANPNLGPTNACPAGQSIGTWR